MSSQILFFLIGLILFLFSMIKLSSKIQLVIAARAREYIRRITKRPLYGLGLGAILTAIFQSSSAMTVVLVGMTSAGLITFYHSLAAIFGANIGTTITAQLLAFKITAIAPYIIIAGFLFWLLAKEDKLKIIGESIFYFGLLFFGMALMAEAMAPLRGNQKFISFLARAENPLIGILVAMIFTGIIQASGVTIGLVVLLAQQNLISLEAALPLVLGAKIGTTVTAWLGSFGSNFNGKRVALAHSLFAIFETLLFLPLLSQLAKIVRLSSVNLAQQIANAHTLTSIVCAIIFLSLSQPFAGLVRKIIPGKEKVLPLWAEYLNKKYLFNPNEALNAVAKELQREIVFSKKIVNSAIALIFEFKKAIVRDLFYIEMVVDNLQKEIAGFLNKTAKLNLTKEQAEKVLHFSATVDDIERIADLGTNIAKLSQYKALGNIQFSPEANKELKEICNLVEENLEKTSQAVIKISQTAIESVFQKEKEIDELCSQARKNHLERFYKGTCKAGAGPIFNDMIINLERISDHCEAVAEYMRDVKDHRS